MPFQGSDHAEIERQIVKGFDLTSTFANQKFPEISDSAKHFIASLLESNPNSRSTTK